MSEHTIGMWKGRFPWLRSIRMKIREDKKYLQQIIQVIRATVILHNFLIEENDAFEDSWYDLECTLDIDNGGPEYAKELNRSACHNSKIRRTQLMNYFDENNLI